MDNPVKMRDVFSLRPMQFIDEGYSEIDNESTMSLDMDSVDYSFQEGQAYAQKDDAYSWSDDECCESVELDSISSPYDQEEVERLELMHLIFTMASDGYLHLAPINRYPQRILDIGCGTGTWCIEMADSYQSAEVIGLELTPSQPLLVPPNLSFEIDEFEEEWTFSRSFDFIHARLLAGRILDWPRLMRQCFENCSSGGWAEFQDVDPLYSPRCEPMPQSTAFHGQVIYPGPFLAQWMHEAGFINVHIVKRNQPVTSNGGDSRLQMDLCYDNLMNDDVRASPISINLCTVYGQKP